MGRARRMVGAALGLSSPHGPFGLALRACMRVAIALWLVELAAAWLVHEPPGASGSSGALAALGATLLAGFALGLPLSGLGLLLVWAAGGEGPVSAARRWLDDGAPDVQASHVASLLALLLLLPPGGLVAFAASHSVIAAMAQPRFAAVTVVALHAALLLLSVPLWPTALSLASRLRGALSRVAPLAPLLSRPRPFLLVLAVLSCASAALVVAFAWSTLQFLPWSTLLTFVAALSLAFVAARIARRSRAWVRAEGVIFIAAVAVGAVALGALDGRSAASRRALHDTLGGRAGHAIALAALDFDGDGYLHVLGGRDCAPFDARINPVAPDVPSNGIDEDCDGADLDPKSFSTRLRRDWPVPESHPQKLPVVLITVDAFAANRMAAMGGTRGNTPRIDALAREGTLFTACFSQGPSTRLSFPSIMTSRWDTQIARKLEGRHPFPIEGKERMLAEVLSAAGYDTTAIISDRYFSRRHWKSITQGFKHVVESPAKAGKNEHNSVEVTDAALAALAGHDEAHPAFLWVHYYDAHSPHTQPKDMPEYGRSREDVYDAELQLVDREVGRLVDGVRERLGQRVLIALTADHGIAFDAPRHRKFNYGYDLHTVVLHVPLLFVGPGIAPATLSGAVTTMDLAPTLTNLLRVKGRAPFEGASLVPELLEGRISRPQTMMHQFYITERLRDGRDPLEIVSLRTERYHLIHDRRVDTYELYDWRRDYYERDDLAGAAVSRATLDALRQQLALYTYRYHRRQGEP